MQSNLHTQFDGFPVACNKKQRRTSIITPSTDNRPCNNEIIDLLDEPAAEVNLKAEFKNEFISPTSKAWNRMKAQNSRSLLLEKESLNSIEKRKRKRAKK